MHETFIRVVGNLYQGKSGGNKVFPSRGQLGPHQNLGALIQLGKGVVRPLSYKINFFFFFFFPLRLYRQTDLSVLPRLMIARKSRGHNPVVLATPVDS